jgi:uncharacterized protein (TIGR02600 family)
MEFYPMIYHHLDYLSRRRAAALLIVLASLVFLAALALAFLASIGTELKSSKQYADGVSAKLLSQSAFNLATDQIVAATKGYSGPDEANQGDLLAWASQPGMIRTYNSSGQKAGYFKLYSWDVMQGTGDFDPNSITEAISTTWYQNPALYTDLNAPVRVSGTYQYPIVDGNGLASNVQDNTGTISINGKTYDSDGDFKWDIEGFNVTTATPVESGTSNPVPMPVKWLYVLQDGQLVAPGSASGKSVTFTGTIKPTSANPIVGRIAFWTDDDSSKININTAAEGIFWDTPRVKSKQDDVYKIFQPVNGEYQRYPGHPAMTSLSTVLKAPPSWSPGTTPPSINLGAQEAVKFTFSSTQWAEYEWAKLLYGIAPRVGKGGSAGGTAQTAMLWTGSPAPKMSLDADRLYASVDELTFKPDRTSNNLELANQGVLNKTLIERAKFFLTASSRAPDVNLFNKPRVAIWPINTSTSTNYRTAFDRLIAFCSTFGGYTYYFERSNPNSATADLALNRNMKLLTYLRALASQNVPGFGGDFGSKYADDKDQIFTEIFDYIRSTNLRDPLLVHPTNELLSTSYTIGDNSGAWPNSQSPKRGTNGQGQVVPILDVSTSTRGFGRHVSLQGASVLFIGQVDGDGPICPVDESTKVPDKPGPTEINTQSDPITGKPLPIYSGSGTNATILVDRVESQKMRIQAMFLPQFFCPAVGATWLRSNFKWSVSLNLRLIDPDTSASIPLLFSSNESGGSPKVYSMSKSPWDETGFGDQLGLIYPVQMATTNIVSDSLDIKKGVLRLRGTAVVTIYAMDGTTPIQKVELDFQSPDATNPALAWDHVANRSEFGFDATELPQVNYVNYRTFASSSGRYNAADPANPIAVQGGRITGGTKTRQAGGFIMAGDTIRSIGTVSGDGRITAAQAEPLTGLFKDNPATDNLLGAHNFVTGYGHSYYGAGFGKLVKDLSYPGSGTTTANQNTTDDLKQTVFFNQGYAFGADTTFNGVEAGSNAAISGGIMGDWDNGPFATRDGPYIGKADEGDIGGSHLNVVSELKEPYFWKIKSQSGGSVSTALFTPNRMVPSAVTFGSLSTGVKRNLPWQTLLFRPMPGHPGSGAPINSPVGPPYTTPPDHLLLELFSMPVVEPYAISEPMSTAGRINMNYQMIPFTYINRDTGIRALLKAEKVTAISDTQAGVYKYFKYSTAPQPTQQYVRYNVNADETLKGFKQRFDSKDIFRSASEICDLYIVPKDDQTTSPSYAGSTLDTFNSMAAYWETKRLTGDNTKERIYATLYPRLTTKSNTFTIHAKVQTLKKVVGTPPDVWTEDKDQVTGEYRGSQTVERYVDPNASGIPDYSNAAENTPISSFYKTRVISSKQFAP